MVNRHDNGKYRKIQKVREMEAQVTEGGGGGRKRQRGSVTRYRRKYDNMNKRKLRKIMENTRIQMTENTKK